MPERSKPAKSQLKPETVKGWKEIAEFRDRPISTGQALEVGRNGCVEQGRF
jgi:hypothetical protein